jgi:hypothetical protein
MHTETLTKKFTQMGARLKVTEAVRRRGTTRRLLALDVQNDRSGEYFEVFRPPGSDAEVQVLDVQPKDRHLLLLVREGGEKQKFLCGHDERHWFVAAVPESAPVGTVGQAKEALKPGDVRTAQAQKKISGKARNRRKNAAYVRQGEWFFVPVPGMVVDESLVLRNEPLARGGGKPHLAEFCYRTGGETVYVCTRHPNGVTAAKYSRILSRNPKAEKWGWRVMRRNPGVYVRGRIRHADHRTIALHGWHRVLMNTETQSRAMRNVAFID